jgi:hypothetical protein
MLPTDVKSREAEQSTYEKALFVGREVGWKTASLQWQLARRRLQGPSWGLGSDCRVIFC